LQERVDQGGLAVNILLTPELEQMVQEKVASGQYHSASEVVHEALCLLKERDELLKIRYEELKAEITKGIEAGDRGEVVPGEEVFQKLRERLAELSSRRK
jgi:antitoxin ParD1/3/4